MAYATINKSDLYFNTLLYTGNGSTLTVTGNNFQPNFTWIKERSAAGNHKLADVVRGPTKYLSTNNTNIEDSTGSGIQSWNSTGFSLSNATDINDSGQTYAAWNWLASNTTTNNTSGTISSVVSANQTAGFSVVSYTGNGTSGASIGHGLGSTPAMIICKSRSDAEEWATYHQSLTYTKYIVLNSTAAAVSTARFYQAPTSSLFYVDNGYGVNKSSATYMAYCFAEVKGFSKFGSYTGNGSADGTFVYTGFKPAFVLCRAANSVVDWHLFDNKRLGYNASQYVLKPNTSGTEFIQSSILIDFVSNGFKLRGVDSAMNGSGETIIYMAFAENPLVGTNNIPTTAR